MRPGKVKVARVVAQGVWLCMAGNPLPASAQTAPAPALHNEAPEAPSPASDNVPASLFFSPDESSRIRMALALYDPTTARVSDSTAGNSALKAGSGSSDIAYVYPQFFLQSLAYHSPDDWFIWVNGQKITSATQPSSSAFHVSAINGNQVTLSWFPPVMAKVNAVWDHLPSPPDPSIRVDKAAGKVEFTLRPNQTFSSYGMRVLEGKVVPVSEGGNAVDLPAKTDKTPDKPSPVSAMPVPNTRQGLDSLLNSYQQLGHKP